MNVPLGKSIVITRCEHFKMDHKLVAIIKTFFNICHYESFLEQRIVMTTSIMLPKFLIVFCSLNHI